MKNCIVKIIDNVFEKNDEGGFMSANVIPSTSQSQGQVTKRPYKQKSHFSLKPLDRELRLNWQNKVPTFINEVYLKLLFPLCYLSI